MFSGYRPVNVTGSNEILAVSGELLGFYVNSTSAGTIVLKHRGGTASAGTAISGTITPAIGFHYFPANFSVNLYAKLAGTIDVTFFVK